MTDTPDLDRTLDLDRIGAVIFEIDGVVANTAPVHAAAWKHSLDMFLRGRCRARGVQAAPFDVQMDYLRYLDGRTVSDGVREFLASRGVDDESVDLLDDITRRQVTLFLREIERYGVAPFRACVALVRELRDRHAATAAVSTAPIGTRVLTAAQVASLFDVRVDRSHLDGQPTTVRSGGTGQREERDLRQELEEAVLAESVRRLRLPPTQTAVVQRSLTGVRAARRLGFGLVVGVDSGPTVEVSTGPGERTSRDRPSTDRASNERELRRAGAHLVVRDLAQLDVAGRRRPLVKPV